jgi:hypothetical protein
MADTPQYIFGYGSLVEAQSRARTWASAFYASPVIIKGIKRGWFDSTPASGLSPTYLGAVFDDDYICNGVIFPISKEGLAAYIEREVGYIPQKIDQSKIMMLDGRSDAPKGDIWFFANKKEKPASPQYPIVQSYVDICINGCLQLEAGYPMAEGFTKMFIESCTGWNEYWVNDRIYPRRPFIYEPNAYKIDKLLQDVLGKELFSKIQIEPAIWEKHVP